MINWFEPSAARGGALDQRMRERLASSLDYIFNEVGEALGMVPESSAALTAAIRSGPQSPHLFGAYYDLVLAIENDEFDRARLLCAELTSRAPSSAFDVAAIDDRPTSEAERYRRMFLPDAGLVRTPDAALLSDCRRRLDAAFALLDAGFPDMAAEIRALLREIVVAAGPEDPLALTFDGASCYMLWGAILLNARGQTTVLDTAQALAHESGHNLLFGFCASGPLVDNADDELFSSPLRSDPRPMDGVVHAAYVIARMHLTLTRLLDANVLDRAQAEAANKDLAVHVRNFEAGDEIIRGSARLTEVGDAVMAAARAHMGAAVAMADGRGLD